MPQRYRLKVSPKICKPAIGQIKKRGKIHFLPPIETTEMTERITKEAIERFESDMGYKPTAFKMAGLLGGDISHWGRILKGAAIAKGPYLAKLKVLKENGLYSGYVQACAEKTNKYGHRNRKGNLVIHAKNIWYDLDNFHENKIFEDRMQGVYFDDPYDAQNYYFEQSYRFFAEGPHRTESFDEELELKREFIESL
jgi:hypothetical protein